METYDTRPDNACPACGSRLDAATAVREDARPDPGDVSVCVYCAAILRFDRELYLYAPEQWEVDYLLAEIPGLRRAQQAARTLIRRRAAPNN